MLKPLGQCIRFRDRTPEIMGEGGGLLLGQASLIWLSLDFDIPFLELNPASNLPESPVPLIKSACQFLFCIRSEKNNYLTNVASVPRDPRASHF